MTWGDFVSGVGKTLIGKWQTNYAKVSYCREHNNKSFTRTDFDYIAFELCFISYALVWIRFISKWLKALLWLVNIDVLGRRIWKLSGVCWLPLARLASSLVGLTTAMFKCLPFIKGCGTQIDSIEKSHASLTSVPDDVLRSYRTLEECKLDANQIKELPNVCSYLCIWL